MKLQKLNIVILGVIVLLLSACDSGGGDSTNNSDNSNNSDNGGFIVDGDGNVVTNGDGNVVTNDDGNVVTNGDGNVVTVQIIDGSVTSENSTDESNSFQNDCRIPDVLRVGFQIPNADLILFPESISLPTQSGSGTGIRRVIQIPDENPVFFDSLVISEIGTVSVTHVSEGPENTVIELFDLNLENEIRTITTSGQVGEFNGRARIDIALVPGVYCIYLANAATRAFQDNTTLTVDYVYVR